MELTEEIITCDKMRILIPSAKSLGKKGHLADQKRDT